MTKHEIADLLLGMVAKGNSDLFVLFVVCGHQLGAAQGGELGGCYSRCQGLPHHGYHGRARPQHVHTWEGVGGLGVAGGLGGTGEWGGLGALQQDGIN